nr:ATP-binding cassette domain-containing protein [uncultured Sphingomonas sp.]
MSLHLQAGSLTLIRGPSGSGKTTLLAVAGLLLMPTRGAVHVLGKDMSELDNEQRHQLRLQSTGFAFQDFKLIEGLTVRSNVQLALAIRRLPLLHSERAMASVGIEHLADQEVTYLSGGEKQRVALARSLAADPFIILCDEPTAALDTTSALSIARLLQQIAAEGQRCIAVVTHDARLDNFATNRMEMVDGELR